MVLFDSRASTVFTLDAFNSSESVRSAIESISETNQIYHLVDKGLIEARDNVFTAARGDRMNASNYYVFIVGPFESYPEAVAKDIRRNGSNSIFAIHIGNQYQTEYQKAVDTCGDYTKYTNVGSYEKLINIKNDILQKITSCEPVNTTNKHIGSGYGNEYRRIAGNSSNYFFASSFFNLSYIELTVKEAITKCPVSKTTTRDSLRVSTEVQQTPFLVTFMSGATAGIGVTSFAIIFAIILRRFFQQKEKENVHREDNDRDRTSYNMRHSTDPAPPNDSQYTELDTITMTPDNNIALNTTNLQRDTEQTNPPSDNPYLEPIRTLMTQTCNIPG